MYLKRLIFFIFLITHSHSALAELIKPNNGIEPSRTDDYIKRPRTNLPSI